MGPGQTPPRRRQDFADFLADVAPLFHGRGVSYVDVGANRGNTFAEVCAARFTLDRALLFEANPEIFPALKARLAESPCATRARAFNVALSDREADLQMTNRGEMSSVVGASGALPGAAGALLTVHARPLDAFTGELPERRISILKIDVEGHECAVLDGARGLLGAAAAELIYIEAGMEPGNPQLTYYREIEDRLRGHGYRLYRIYEQTGEWLHKRLSLRRVNLAFVSPQVLDDYPLPRVRQLRQQMKAGR